MCVCVYSSLNNRPHFFTAFVVQLGLCEGSEGENVAGIAKEGENVGSEGNKKGWLWGMGAIRRAPVVQGVRRGQWVTQQEAGCKRRTHTDG